MKFDKRLLSVLSVFIYLCLTIILFILWYTSYPLFFTTSSVLFADIAGFTAWSSVREPAQVFVLLETLYGKNSDYQEIIL